MNFNLDSLTYGTIQLRPIVPASFAKLVIPGSRPHCAEGEFGKIFFQEVYSAGITLFYNIYALQEDLALDISIDKPVWLTHIALKNENRYEINGIGPACMKEGQFNTLRSSSIQGTHYLEKNNEYRTLSIYYPASQLKSFLTLFPYLGDFMQEADADKTALLFKNHHWVNEKMIEVIDELIYCPYYGSMRRLFFNYKMKELLLLTFNSRYATIKGSHDQNDSIIKSALDAKQIIEKNVGKSLNLEQIAQQLGMNEVKLSGGFQSIFGMGIVEYMQKIKTEGSNQF